MSIIAIDDHEVAAADLAVLARNINDAHDAATAAAVTTLEKAQYCGRWLLQAKEQVGHGNFTAWLKENTHVSDRTARRYMALTKGWEHLKTDTMADLNLVGAMKATAEDEQKLLALCAVLDGTLELEASK